jgi:hypothetical protein
MKFEEVRLVLGVDPDGVLAEVQSAIWRKMPQAS